MKHTRKFLRSKSRLRRLATTYLCATCGGRFAFLDGWTEEERLAEERDNFGSNAAPEDRVVVCDDCYRTLLPGGKPFKCVAPYTEVEAQELRAIYNLPYYNSANPGVTAGLERHP